MRRFLSIFCTGLLVIGLTTKADSQGFATQGFAAQNRFARLGAWVTTGLLFGGGLVGVEKICEKTTAHIVSLLPFGRTIAGSHFPRLVGGAVSLPLATYLYVKYHKLIWYLAYILYSGKQISPIIAREIAQHLDSYVRCMAMIRQIHQELDVLLKNAESCVAGSGKEQAIRLISQSIDAVFERELADADVYVKRVHRQLADINLAETCKHYSLRGGRVTYSFDLTCMRGFEHPDFSKIDVETLDHLIRDILNYWHDYLTSLAASIDQRVVFCNKIHAMENFISGVLNRPLLPAFEQVLAPTPTIKKVCFGQF
jgi:hypothetical protein